MGDIETFIREVSVTYTDKSVGVDLGATLIESATQSAKFFRSAIGSEAREHFTCLYLDTQCAPIGYQVVSIGTANSSMVHPREVFQPAIGIGACSFVIGHNHPSGDVRPSDADTAVASRLFACGIMLGIGLLDSIIVSRGPDFFSFLHETPEVFSIEELGT